MLLSDFNQAVREYSEKLEQDQDLTSEDLLTAGRLWNTVSYYTTLQSTDIGKRFFELGRDKMLPRIVKALDMDVSRGMSFYSAEWDFMVGGPLAERFRYKIEELEENARK